MPKNEGEVQAFRFDKDSYDEMKPIYISILKNLGVKNVHAEMNTMLGSIPDDKKNGVMFNKIVSGLFKDDQERKTKASEIFEKIKDDPEISPYVKAYIAEMSGDYIPYDTVLTSARMVGGETGKGGKSLQMGCGEGKTGVLSMAAYAILMQDKSKQVFLTSSTENLAAEALDKIKFYDKVGLASEVVLVDSKGITRAARDKKGNLLRDDTGNLIIETIDLEKKSESFVKEALKEAYSSRLVISDNVTLMQDAMKGYLEEPSGDRKRELLADEADFVLLDSYRPLQRTVAMSEKEMNNAAEQRKIAYDILENVKKQMPEGLFVKDDSSQYVDFTKEGRAAIVAAVKKAPKIDGMDPNTVYDYVYDALVVDTVYKENRDYQILNGGKKIVSEDRASGVGIDLPEGVRQALEIKLQKEGKYFGEISPERKVIDTLNTQSFFKKFFNGPKHFVSGTLGVDSKAIAEELKNFGVSKEEGDIYEAPPKEKRSRDDQPRRYLKTPGKKRSAIIKNALEEIGKDRPVLIGTVSEEEINALKEVLARKTKESGKTVRVLEFTAASEDIFSQDKVELNNDQFKEKYGVDKKAYKDYKTLIKNESGKPNTITFGTSILGRGTTIKTSGEVDDNGGIHVIIDGLHETSSRNQEQYKARTARGDNAGSTKEFFCYEDIPEEVRRESYDGMSPDAIYEDVYEKIDARTSGIRNYVVQFVEKTVQKLNEIDEMDMPDEYKDQAKALLAQRAFSIKNRACGVSDKFQNNIDEYTREIDAYAALYVAKYNVTDKEYLNNGRFDEVKWLKDHNYEDLAEMHMPFKKTREKEIFRHYGINSGKVKNEPIAPAKKETKKQDPTEPEKPKSKKAKKAAAKAANMAKINDQEAETTLQEMAVDMTVEEASKQTAKISDKEADKVFQAQAVELNVDENFQNKAVKESAVVKEELTSQVDVGTINVDNVQKYEEVLDLKEEVNDSKITLFGIKTGLEDEKNGPNLFISNINRLVEWFKNAWKFQSNNRDNQEAQLSEAEEGTR